MRAYTLLIEQLQVFDANGQLRCASKAAHNARQALSILEQLQLPKLNKHIRAISKRIEEGLFNFLHTANCIVKELEKDIAPDLLTLWTKAWQIHKNLIKAKSPKRKTSLKAKLQEALLDLKQTYQWPDQQFNQFKQSIFIRLNAIVQSSALVQSVNAIIRQYADLTRKQLSPAALKLIMFFHNHRKFKRGQRKGLAPIELLKGIQLQKGPIDLMLDHFYQQQ